jgi:hypothetical protein
LSNWINIVKFMKLKKYKLKDEMWTNYLINNVTQRED